MLFSSGQVLIYGPQELAGPRIYFRRGGGGPRQGRGTTSLSKPPLTIYPHRLALQPAALTPASTPRAQRTVSELFEHVAATVIPDRYKGPHRSEEGHSCGAPALPARRRRRRRCLEHHERHPKFPHDSGPVLRDALRRDRQRRAAGASNSRLRRRDRSGCLGHGAGSRRFRLRGDDAFGRRF